MKILDKKEYIKLVDTVRQVGINNLFARSVIENKVAGRVYVDQRADPKTCYIVHPYGMSLLLGDKDNRSFNEIFRRYALNTDEQRDKYEWMQAYPNDWDDTLTNLFSDVLIKSSENNDKTAHGIIELNTRVNFKFNKDKFLSIRKARNSHEIQIVKTDRRLFREIKGSVIPKNFWNSEDDFLDNGFSLSLLYKGELASMAFSSFWFDNQFELGIETQEKFRGKGLAEIVCSSLIDYCLDNGLTPVWACRLENIGSYKLALKLGFEPNITIPYYRLAV